VHNLDIELLCRGVERSLGERGARNVAALAELRALDAAGNRPPARSRSLRLAVRFARRRTLGVLRPAARRGA